MRAVRESLGVTGPRQQRCSWRTHRATIRGIRGAVRTRWAGTGLAPGGHACLRRSFVRRKHLIGPALCAALAATAVFWPADAQAQRRGPRVRAIRPVVVVARPYYRPYSRPYFSGYFWQGYPYPYPYPYGYRWDDRSELRIQATPRETQVYVDGYFVGVVDDFDGFAQRL